MSLIKQIRIAISVIIMMVAAGCLTLGVYDDHRFMAEQLQKKNTDNANALAITLSNIQKDQVTVELIVSAQFDMGHYHRIAVLSPEQKVMIERVDTRTKTNAPDWFKRWLPIQVSPGVASIQAGWQQYGTLVMESETALAYDQLWETTRHSMLWTLIVAFLSYLLSGFSLRKIMQPLGQVIAQAEALGERVYITTPEPKTLEFKQLVRTMNTLSGRVKQMVTEESARLSDLNQKINYDEVTGLMNQAHFSNTVSALLKDENFVEGALWVVQLRNLAGIDKQLGYSATNQLIKKIADQLQATLNTYPGMFSGRLSGGMFAIFSRQSVDDFAVAMELKRVLEKLSAAQKDEPLQFVMAHAASHKGGDYSDIEHLMAFILDLTNEQVVQTVHMINANSIITMREHHLQHWNAQLVQAIEHKQIRLERYPVMQRQHQLLHDECPMRLRLEDNGPWLPAGEFLEWASQLNMIETLDGLAAECAVAMLQQGNGALSLNVSGAAMLGERYHQQLQDLLSDSPAADRISFEIGEEYAFSNYEAFKQFVKLVKGLGCKVGLEHVAHRLAYLGDLHELGLDFVKFDASLIRDVHLRTQQQALLRGLCMLVRTMGIMPIAEGVQSQEELDCLAAIGFEAVTGPYVNENVRFGE